MDRYLCQLCKTVVQCGDKHPCLFFKDDDIVYTVPQPDETDEVDNINRLETTGENAANNWEMFDTTPHISKNSCDIFQTTLQNRNSSQASILPLHSVPSVGKQEENEMDSGFTDGPVPPPSTLHAANYEREMDAEGSIASKQPLAESAAIRLRTFGPDGKTLYVCDVCTYRCKDRLMFVNHYKTHTGEKPYKCPFCGRGVALKGNLITHLRTHTGEKPYACEICGERFAQLSHCKTHTDSRHVKRD